MWLCALSVVCRNNLSEHEREREDAEKKATEEEVAAKKTAFSKEAGLGCIQKLFQKKDKPADKGDDSANVDVDVRPHALC